METAFIETINAYDTSTLKKEQENLRLTLEKQKRIIDEVSKAYNVTQRAIQIIDLALRMREEGPAVSVSPTASTSPSTSASPSPAPGYDGDKQALALEIIRRSNGLSRGDLIAEMDWEGAEINAQYTSTILQRLKKRGEVYTKDGKYYPTPREKTG